MAKSEFSSTVNAALVEAALNARAAFKWAQACMYFGKGYQSEGTDSIITVKKNLKKQAGDTIRVRLRAPLTGAGQKDDDTLQGNEEALSYYTATATIHQRRHAVRVAGRMTEKRTKVPVRKDAREGLGDWLAQMMDTDTVLAISGLANAVGTLAASAPTTYRRWVGGQTAAGVLLATANDLDAELGTGSSTKTYVDHLFGTLVIQLVKRMAITPGSGYPKIRPIRYQGKDYYIMWIHPLQAKALKAETAWIAAQRSAGPRDMTNPLFSGSLGVFDGVVIKEWEKIELRVGDGVGTDPTTYFESGDAATSSAEIICRALFCGAQAAIHAWGKEPGWDEERFDYGNEWGIATDLIWAAKKTVFNSQDFGVIAVDTCVATD